VRGLDDPGKVVAISLDELVWGDRERAYGDLLGFLELDDQPAMREFFEQQMSAGAAHRERWREGLGGLGRRRVQRKYRGALAALEREGNHAAGPLIDAYERLS
jgi:hypothetical protein